MYVRWLCVSKYSMRVGGWIRARADSDRLLACASYRVQMNNLFAFYSLVLSRNTKLT